MGIWIVHLQMLIPYLLVFLAFAIAIPDLDHIGKDCSITKQRCSKANPEGLFLHNPKLVLLAFMAALGWLVHLLTDFSTNGFVYGGI